MHLEHRQAKCYVHGKSGLKFSTKTEKQMFQLRQRVGIESDKSRGGRVFHSLGSCLRCSRVHLTCTMSPLATLQALNHNHIYHLWHTVVAVLFNVIPANDPSCVPKLSFSVQTGGWHSRHKALVEKCSHHLLINKALAKVQPIHVASSADHGSIVSCISFAFLLVFMLKIKQNYIL